MIGTEGLTDTGKSEFILSAPGPGIVECVDRGIDPVFDNPTPPAARRSDFAIVFNQVPMLSAGLQSDYAEYYKSIKAGIYKALDNPDAVTVAIDGDSDLWELQVLAAFGKNKQIWPQTRWEEVKAPRRAFTARLHDSGKIIIGTNKLKDEYKPIIDEKTGKVMLEDDGKTEKRNKTGNSVRQGFPDQDYLWDIQLRHLYEPPKYNTILKKQMSGKFGIRILKCKANMELVGSELWGESCNFAGLVQLAYPQIPLEDWGF